MSRHRNVRRLYASDEYADDDDVYGHSVEDDYCISPSDAAQFIYNREGTRGQQRIGAFFQSSEDIAEQEHELSELDRARVQSCITKIKSTIDVSLADGYLTGLIIKYNFDIEKVIDSILSRQVIDATKQRIGFNLITNSVAKHNFSSPVNLPKPAKLSDMCTTSPVFSSLADLTKSHLQTNKIDKASIFGSSSLNTPKLNLFNNNKKPFDLKNLERSLDDKPDPIDADWHIDLSSALRVPQSNPILEKKTITEEKFVPSFIDCESQNYQLDICKLDVSDLIFLNHNLESRVSKFGKIITRVFKRKPKITFSHKIYDAQYFQFKTPSPDDIVLTAQRRNVS